MLASAYVDAALASGIQPGQCLQGYGTGECSCFLAWLEDTGISSCRFYRPSGADIEVRNETDKQAYSTVSIQNI